MGRPAAAEAPRAAAALRALLDTAVVVDLLRAHPPALAWLAGQDRLGLSPIVWLEIVEGAKDSRAQRRAVQLLQRFDRTDPLPEDFDWAIEQALRLRLSHTVDMMDCLIASTAHRLSLPLYTRNMKHFVPLLGALARQPYS
jgi:predicted nucleic acid-binding protein